MAQYTKRTCTCCGIRDIQPNMVQREVKYKTGSSKAGMSGSTLLGSMLDNKRSTKALTDSILNNKQRNYYRTRKEWVCKKCASSIGDKKSKEESVMIWTVVILFALIYAAISV